MVLNDPIADSLSKIDNSTRALNNTVMLRRSKLIINILNVLKNNGYVGSYEEIEDGKQGLIKVNLIGTINSCKVVKPRYPVKVEELEKYEQRYLPAKDFGVLIISTNKGLLTQKEAREQNVGGTIVAYCY